ncbi:GumC family protein [Caulobacter sp. NIBR2454]|uniref:GumC family protein n=1 Tax=Caulobacter sp. NIBR2454 TaxID=3015996 RepID=UPI0022B6A8A2|nr:hypothetical protein [Caulobacter sp. NIBR2454]
MTARDFLTPVFYYKRIAIIAFLVPVLLALVAAVLAKPVYTAQSRLLILLGSEYTFRSGAAGDERVSFDRAQIVNAEMEILQSRELRLRTIREVGLEKIYPGTAPTPAALDRAAEQLSRDLAVQAIPQSNVVEVSLRNREPRVAAEVLGKLLALYAERRLEVFQQADIQAVVEQRDNLRRRLDEIEGSITRFSDEHSLSDYSQDLIDAQAQKTALSAQIQQFDQQIASAQARTRQYRGRSAAAPQDIELQSDIGPSMASQDLNLTLLRLQEQRRQAVAKFKDGYPLIKELDAQIATVQAAIAAAPKQQLEVVRRGANPLRQQFDAALATNESEAAGLSVGRQRLEQSLQAAQVRVDELVGIGPVWRELLRNRSVIEAAYQEIAKRAEDARLESIFSRSRANVRVIQAPEALPSGHSGRLTILAIGVLLGAVSAAAGVVIAATFSQVMISPADVEAKLELPTLAAPPAIDGQKPPHVRLDQLRPVFLSHDDSGFLMRILATVGREHHALVQFIAANTGEGTSSLALDFAIAAAQRKQRVLLLDVEPEGGGVIGHLRSQGATLSATETAGGVMRVGSSRLYVASTRGLDLSEDRLSSAIIAARNSFDLVVMAAPALQQSYLGVTLSGLSDLTAVVIEAEQTRAAVVRNLLDKLDAAGADVAGAILNKRRFYIPRLIYGWL